MDAPSKVAEATIAKDAGKIESEVPSKLGCGYRQPAAAGGRGPAAARRGRTGQPRDMATRVDRYNGIGDDGSGNDDSGSLEDELQQEPDPLYDERADDEDAAWADRQRGGRASDAVLSCPGCFTTLCIDCQRHEKYHQQYRAMFVMNCQVEEEDDEGSAGGFDPASQGVEAGGGKGRGGRRPKRSKTSAQYRRVRCGVCSTEVGALEVEEELYHFYHVFPSNA